MASTRHPRSRAPRVNEVATGWATPSKMSAITVEPSRLRAWVIPLAVGGDQSAFQHPHSASDPVTFLATSV
jgi:hypothetical protein